MRLALSLSPCLYLYKIDARYRAASNSDMHRIEFSFYGADFVTITSMAITCGRPPSSTFCEGGERGVVRGSMRIFLCVILFVKTLS